MKLIAVLLTTPVLLASAISVSAQIPPPPRNPTQTAQPVRDRARSAAGTAIIRGRVYAADTGSPLRRARVTWSALDRPSDGTAGAESPGVMTDANGRYELRGLVAGRYRIAAKRTGYLQADFGARAPVVPGRRPTASELGITVELADGQVFADADFHLPRAGVITGRVLDELGDPLVNAIIGVSRASTVNGRTRTAAAGIDTTDDQGEYRVWGLPPGSYYAVASAPTQMRMPGQTTSFADVLYPGVYQRDQARPIVVAAGQEVAGVNFTLMPARLARISGSVVTSQGRAPAKAAFSVETAGSETGFRQAAVYQLPLDAEARFSIPSVAPGSYDVSVRAETEAGITELGTTRVAVNGDDVTGVTIVTGGEVRLSGRVFVEGGGRLPAGTLRIAARLAGDETEPMFFAPGAAEPRPGTVGADGAFALRVGPGTRMVSVTGLPAGWTLASVRAGDDDLTDLPLELGAGTQLALTVGVTNRLASIVGEAVDEEGKPTWDYTAVVFPKDPSRCFAGSPLVRTARPNQAAQFRIEDLRAGEYYVAAVVVPEDRDPTAPEELQRLRAQATAVVVTPVTQKPLQLKVVRLATGEK